jgi:hypothetical protein
MASKWVKWGIGIAIGATLVGLVKKAVDFTASLTISVDSLKFDLKNLLTGNLGVTVQTFIDNHSNFKPKVTGLVVRTYYWTGSAWSSLGVSAPISQEFTVIKGRNRLSTQLTISLLGVGQSLIAKGIKKYKVEVTTLTNISTPIVAESVFEYDFSAVGEFAKKVKETKATNKQQAINTIATQTATTV